MENITINIANDFSDSPGARYKTDGDFSGQQFYEDKLKPKLEEVWDDQNKAITLNFDGTYGYASSFISEVFLSVVRDFHDKNKIKEKLNFVSNDEPLLIPAINAIIDNAE
jgi:uncharacterized protein DUF4325